MHQRGKLTGERAAIEAQLTKVHHRKSVLEMEWVVTGDLTHTRAQARDVTDAINQEGLSQPTLARASQNVATVAAHLDTFPVPSTNGADKVYCELKEILSITTVPQADRSL
jgi:hypothetical protein